MKYESETLLTPQRSRVNNLDKYTLVKYILHKLHMYNNFIVTIMGMYFASKGKKQIILSQVNVYSKIMQ